MKMKFEEWQAPLRAQLEQQKEVAKQIRNLPFEQGLSLVEEAQKKGIKPNVVMLTILVNKPDIGVEQAIALVKAYEGKGIVPDEVMVTNLYWKSLRKRKAGRVDQTVLKNIDQFDEKVRGATSRQKDIARTTAHLVGGQVHDTAKMLQTLLVTKKEDGPWSLKEMEMTGTLVFAFLPEQHPLREALSQTLESQGILLLQAVRENAKRFDDVLIAWAAEQDESLLSRYGGGNVWDGAHMVPVNTQAVEEFSSR